MAHSMESGPRSLKIQNMLLHVLISDSCCWIILFARYNTKFIFYTVSLAISWAICRAP